MLLSISLFLYLHNLPSFNISALYSDMIQFLLLLSPVYLNPIEKLLLSLFDKQL